MELRVLSAADVAAAVEMAEAIEVMRSAFAALSAGDADVPLRLALESQHGVHLVMPAHVRTSGALGLKVVSVNPGNHRRGLPAIHALVVALDAETGRARAVMDGTWLTALRTGAAGGLAADVLSRPDASVVALFGAGPQAVTQLEAVRCVRPVTEVRVVAAELSGAQAFVDQLEGVDARALDDPVAAIRGADIVVTATNSTTPVFPGAALDPGTHVTGVGSFTPEMREVDTDLVRRARVFVDQRAPVLAEAGDLAGPIGDGDVDENIIVGELGEVVTGRCEGRISADDITFFKSVGNAVQDVAVAARVLEAAEREGLGTLVPL